jgi:hypothetical protein
VLALVSCAPPARSAARDVPFFDLARVQMSAHDGPAAIAVGPAVSALVRDVAAPAGRVLVGAFQGAERTGGHAIAIDLITRDGDRLMVRATFTVPPPGAVVTQVLTSPAHVVAIASGDMAGVRTVILLDEGGAERARTTLS